MQRFFLPTLLPEVDEVVSLAAIHHQLRRVLRVQPGMQVIVLDNAGNERLLEVESVERRDTFARVVEMRPAPPEPTVPVTLYQCIPKMDRFELILQKATELGVAKVVPVISSRTVVRPGRTLAAKQTRWETIVREAAEQSGRGRLPVVAEACTFEEALASAAGTRLLPWEEGAGSSGLMAALSQGAQPIESVSLLIGPEGGLEGSEILKATDLGWQVVSLGKRILRVETAAIVALALVTAALGELGDAPTVKVAVPAPKSKKREGAEDGGEEAISLRDEKRQEDKNPEKNNQEVESQEAKSQSGTSRADRRNKRKDEPKQ